MKNARFIIAIITNLLDEAIILALIVYGLPRLGIYIPLYGTILIGVAFLIYAIVFYMIGSTILKKKPLPGLTDMVGVRGRTIGRLAPKGFVKIEGELWEAQAESNTIDPGANVIVIQQKGLKLVVRAETSKPDSQSRTLIAKR